MLLASYPVPGIALAPHDTSQKKAFYRSCSYEAQSVNSETEVI